MKAGACKYICLLIFIILCSFPSDSTAQADSGASKQSKEKLKSIFSVGAAIQHGFIFAHTSAVNNTKGSNPTGVEAILSWQRNDAASWNLCNCFPRKGLLLSYYSYDNKILGRSYTAAYFLEPTYRLRRNIFFSFKAAVGFSYLTNPFDVIKNPTNNSYSTRINQYMSLGAGLWFRLDNNWWLNTSINYHHESNGGMKHPNKGINWPTAGVAFSYQKNSRTFYTGSRSKEKFWRGYSVRWDIGIFSIAKRVLDENGISKRLPVMGLSLQAAKQVGRINTLTLGTEAFRDDALRFQLKLDSIKTSHFRAGILAGHEFILGRFLFSQRLGLYFFDKTPYFDRVYHRWGIHYRINRRLGVGFQLLAHRQVADFGDMRLTYTVQKKYK